MAERNKVMNASEMEQWLIRKGAVPVTEDIKSEPWYEQVSKLPPCLTEATATEAETKIDP